MNNDGFIPGIGLGCAISAVICSFAFSYKETNDWIKPAARLGYGHYVPNSPDSSSTHWEWKTNRYSVEATANWIQ